MYIEEVIIDGFKSYATRTVVSGFDIEFNAITGLNGSGKSNILDAICFVLGITNLSAVRAANLADLVYKQGQAGVTKASVCIVFNNADAKRSPVGYESEKRLCITREVVVGGKNRYVVNGHAKQAAQVQTLFHSVSLNVNNPHFLIMQGRITKVLNMKPPEILSMVEEAAGTRMFETKKEQALKTLEKKQSKVEEIERVLTEDIVPRLERLRLEKAQYLDWSSNAAECNSLERFCVAADFMRAEESLEKSNKETENALKEEAAKRREAEDADKEAGELEKKEAGARSKDGAAGRAAQRRRELQAEEESKVKEVVQREAEVGTARTQHEAEVEAGDLRQKAAAELEKSRAKLQGQVDKAQAVVEKKESEHLGCQEKASLAAKSHKAACCGTLDDESQGDSQASTRSAGEQLGDARDALACAKGIATNAVKKAAKLEKMRSETAKAAKAHAKEKGHLEAAFKAAEQTQDKKAAKLKELPVGSNNLSEMRETTAKLRDEKRSAEQRAATLESQLAARLAFDFSDPGKGFDKSKVRGVLASLVRPLKVANSAALEVVAGGRLYQVVVDDEQTGKALLEKGKLKRRVTLVPLSKVQSRPLQDSKKQAAVEIASGLEGSATVAIELLGFEGDVSAAVEYAFGSTLVCDSLETARKVAFDKRVRTKCVTLQGDVCNPAGTLSGGSASNGLGSVLTRLYELHEARSLLKKTEAALEKVESEMRVAERDSELRATLERDWSVAKTEAEAAREAMAACEGQAALDSLAKMDEDLAANAEEAKKAKEDQAHAAELIKAIEEDGEALEAQRERELNRLAKEAQSCATKEEQALATLKTARDKHREVLADLEATSTQGSKSSSSEEKQHRKESEEASARLQEAEKQLKTAVEALEAQRTKGKEAEAELKEAEAEARGLSQQRYKLEEAATAARLQAQKLSHVSVRLAKEKEQFQKQIGQIEADHDWIQHERAFFGQPGTDYDFSATEDKNGKKRRSVSEARALLKELKTTQARAAKKINKRVMGLIEKAEREYDDLRHKKTVVNADGMKIRKVITQLEIKKRETLIVTCAKVDKDFGAIFSTLLPGTTAKLEPPEGCDVLEGLEVRVAFGNIWKDSLSELSGGQRSLIALSLVLAMLKFKPAPMYILDEVDAALDLSHTQNIGRMLRAHFKASQFIVVSLKEGMFNNANVIFRTKFVEGVSTVSRNVTKHNKAAAGDKTKK